MIPQTEQRDVASSGADDSASFDISPDDVAWIMTILRDTLYSDKIMAVLREYGTNAWDANRMAGRGDVPIEVTLPTLGTPELVIRDRGPGLSHESIRQVYTKYGASTKRTSNEGAGMLGIGSKSGFAYSDSFTITSWNGGTKRVYIAVLNDDKGRCDLMHSEPCAPEDTGVEIKIAVRPQDCTAFEERARKLFSHFEPRPKINCTLPEPFTGRELPGLGRIDERDGWEHNGKWFAVMGPVAYAVDLGQLGGTVNGVSLGNAARNVGGVLPFDIGALQVSASREGLKYGDATREALIRRINDIIDEYVRTMLSNIDTLSQWDQRLRIRLVERKSLPVPARFRDIYKYGSHVELKPWTSFTLSHRNYNGRQVPTTSISVQPESKFVIRNEKKIMAGYALRESDILVSPAPGYELKLQTVLQELKGMLSVSKAEGAPIVQLSTIKWEQPVTKAGKPGKPRDNARAKARMFTLDTSKRFFDDQRSESWLPVERVPLDTDVFVVLESYRVQGMEGFYETFRQDEEILKKVGLVIPQIIGYKTTAARTVDVAKVKGTEYRKWRNTGMIKLLMTVPNVAAVVQAAGFDNGYSSLDVPWLTQALGADHVVTRYAAAEASGKIAWSKATLDVRLAASHAKNAMRREELDAYKMAAAVSERYPLFKAHGTGLAPLKEHHRELWLDYVKTIDLLDGLTNPKKEEEAA